MMKNTIINDALKDQFADQLRAWVASDLLAKPLRSDLSMRAVESLESAVWQPCPIANTEVRLLEFRNGENPRFTALIRLKNNATTAELGYWRKLEALVLSGHLQFGEQRLPTGHYIRLPALVSGLTLNSDASSVQNDACIYIAFAGGHYPKEDDEPRIIDTSPTADWLPGPDSGIEVMPLHVHGSANAMLLRGEEILVLRGALSDENGTYKSGTWIRNPVVSWQHWSGTKGTVVFYKSGHFQASADNNRVTQDDNEALDTHSLQCAPGAKKIG